MFKRGLILSGVHLLLVASSFLLFGIGLEGGSRGSVFFWALLQPLVMISNFLSLPVAIGMGLIPVNSAVWGFGGALLLTVLRGRPSHR